MAAGLAPQPRPDCLGFSFPPAMPPRSFVKVTKMSQLLSKAGNHHLSPPWELEGRERKGMAGVTAQNTALLSKPASTNDFSTMLCSGKLLIHDKFLLFGAIAGLSLGGKVSISVSRLSLLPLYLLHVIAIICLASPMRAAPRLRQRRSSPSIGESLFNFDSAGRSPWDRPTSLVPPY